VAEGQRLLATEGVEVETVTALHEADMQFAGQTHVLTVAVSSADFERDDLLRAFERAYWERFEVALAEMRCLLVNLRTTIVGRRRAVSLEGLAGTPATGAPRRAQTAGGTAVC